MIERRAFKKRALLVDPDVAFREALRHNLACGGRTVEAVSGAGEARAKAATGPIDLALIELRLNSPGDVRDYSGVELARRLKAKGVYVVLLCCEPPPRQKVEEWLSQGAIDAYLQKGVDARGRHREVSRIFDEVIPVNFDLEVSFDGREDVAADWEQLSELMEYARKSPSRARVYAPHVENLFRRLFPKPHHRPLEAVTGIDIEGGPLGSGGAGAVRVTAVHDATHIGECLLVKFGRRKRVRAENENFARFIEPLGPRNFARKRWAVDWRDLTAIAYWFARPEQKGDCPTLAEYLCRPDCTPKDEAFLIEAIFCEACRPWHEAFVQSCRHEGNGESWSSEHVVHAWLERRLWRYRDCARALDKLGSVQRGMQAEGLQFEQDRVRGRLGGILVEVANPVEFIARQFCLEDQDGACPTAGRLCPVHGDLHARNIFVIDREPYIFDFADVHYGDPFRDFATLETSARFGALYDFAEPDVEPEAIWALEQELVGNGFTPGWNVKGRSPRLQRAARVAYEIRNKACQLGRFVREPEAHYALTLLFCLLKMAGVGEVSIAERDEHASWRRKLAFLTAGALVDRAKGAFRSPGPAVPCNPEEVTFQPEPSR